MIFKNNFFTVQHSIDTDIGLMRNNNEDSARIESFTGHNKKELLIAALADGVGGMSDGEIASKDSVDIFMKTIIREIDSGTFDSNSISSIKNSMLEANEYVLSINKKKKSSEYMASTLTTFVIHDQNITFANSGDSELLLFDEKLMELSEVHREPLTGYLTSCIGVDKNPEIHAGSIKLNKNDILLLSSDGLTDMVTDEIISDILSNTQKTTDQLISDLKEAAFNNGGRDNITIILCKVEDA